ncbi:MAG TPA: MinD/ParA family protein [Myxococcales bacterium]|nr:MinD/ParA family protein [Myxococcales bacterium]
MTVQGKDQANGLRERFGAGRALRVVGVTSGKGGVGKSSFTANLAATAARAGRRVLIVDADLGLANVELLFGLRPRLHVGHVLDGTAEVRDVLAQGPEGIRVLPAGCGLRALTSLDDVQKLRLVAALDELEDAFDVVLVDTGAGIGDNVTFFIGGVQEALLVVTPEPTALTDAYATVKVLSQGGSLRQFAVAVNMATAEAGKDTFDRLCAVTGRFLQARLRYVGHVPRDENVHRAVMAQRPLVQLYPHSPASGALRSIAASLLNGPAPAQVGGGLKFLWSRLLRQGAMAAAG